MSYLPATNSQSSYHVFSDVNFEQMNAVFDKYMDVYLEEGHFITLLIFHEDMEATKLVYIFIHCTTYTVSG